MSRGLFIGIDGGGTHSSAVAVWPDGRVAATASGGGMNFHNDGVETVRGRIEEVVRTLCERAGAPAEKICAGLSALDGPADAGTQALFASDAWPDGALDLQSDAYIALAGCTMGGPGMIAICGTGSMLMILDREGHLRVSGGWGTLLEDAGSGFTLAREALLAVAAEADGTGPATGLTDRALAYFGAEKPRGLIDRIYAPECGPDRIAGFARCVLEEAERGNRTAENILRRNMNRLGSQAAQLLSTAPGVHRTGIYGGIFAHSAAARGIFEEALRAEAPEAEVQDPAFPPELGAVIHLLKREGRLEDAALEKMKTTWKEMRP